MDSASNAMAADQSFWQFSDQLRLQTAALAGLSIGDSIWSSSDTAPSAAGAASFLPRRRPEERRNLDFSAPAPAAAGETTLLGGGAGGGDGLLGKGWDQQLPQKQQVHSNAASVFEDLNGKAAGGGGPFGWKAGAKGVTGTGVGYFNKEVSRPALGGGVGYFNKDLGSKPAGRRNQNFSNDDFFNPKGNAAGVAKKRNSTPNNNNNNGNGKVSSNSNDKAAAAADKRFKTLPASEALPRSEAVGGYIFVCNNDTMPENLQRQLFGLPSRYRDSVRQITPGLPLFLYNYSTHQLHGIFQAASFGGSNIDPTAWEDKKCPGESRFPAQVRAKTKRIYLPLEEDAFRPILHHYDGPKFRLELSVPEALALLDKFEENMG